MYIAMNRFKVNKGREEDFEEVWRNRKTYLHEVPGFLGFDLLRGVPGDEYSVFISHSKWASENAFSLWTKSEAFKKAHQQTRTPEGILLGHPVLETYSGVELPMQQ